MLPWLGHRQGAETVDKFLDWCLELNIPQISLYSLSTENLNRPKKELEEIFKLYYEYLDKWMKKKGDLLDKYQVKVRFVGDLSKLPPKLVKLMGNIMTKTAKYQKKVLNFLVAYGAQFELLNAMKQVGRQMVKLGKIEITPKAIEKNLLVSTPVDLVIRTGGYSRLSNFLLWQAAYAEIYVTNTLWPDFSKKELIKAIKWYNRTQKNFGR